MPSKEMSSIHDFAASFISDLDRHIERLKLPNRKKEKEHRCKKPLTPIEGVSEIKTTLNNALHHPATRLSQQHAECAFLALLEKPKADTGMLQFFHGWNEIHKTTSLISAKLIVRLSLDALSIDAAKQRLYSAVMAHLCEVAKDDLGLGHDGHDGMYPLMAAAFGAKSWEDSQYSVEECRNFSGFLYRTGVAGHRLPVDSDEYKDAVIDAMMTSVASELWNGGEYNFLAQHINQKIIDMHPSLAYDNTALRRASGYVMSHSGHIESRHGLHALAALQKYHQLTDTTFDLRRLEEKMVDYNQRVGKAFRSLHKALH